MYSFNYKLHAMLCQFQKLGKLQMNNQLIFESRSSDHLFLLSKQDM